MACAPPPSTTNFLPCLLTIAVAAFTSLFNGLGSLTTVIGTIGENSAFNFETVVLAIRSLPWKVGGPIT